NRTIKVDVRVIATTNRNLEQSVEKKEFRQDLFFRLNVVPILVPALRERREDILFLAEQFMTRMARKHGVRVSGISPTCQEMLLAHSWPGNVRELQTVIERAVILCMDGQDLQPDHLGFVPLGSPVKGEHGTAIPVATNITPFKPQEPATPDKILSLHEVEKQHILRALEICEGNRTQAAKHLDISIRTLRNKMHEYEGTAPGTDGAEAEGLSG
ncbi:MAG: AAA-type ATPase lid domain-containing protein, partial [Limisphaerales bacterium]